MGDREPPLLKVHRRQYVLGTEAWAPEDGWRSIRLGGVVLSCCPELRIAEVADAEGVPWVLIGLALQTAGDAGSPIEQIASTPTGDVPELRHDWAGRWLLVSERCVQPDSHAQIGCLLSRDPAGRPWASSSSVLLREICGNAWQDVRLTYQIGAEFYPAPSCSLVGAQRLMPSQRLDPVSGEVSACALVPEIPVHRDPSDLLDESAARLRRAFESLPTDEGPLWMGLSAGGDSRVIFAAAVAASRSTGLAVRPFTWIAGRTRLHDRLLPPRLAAMVGLEHRVIRAGPIDRSRHRLVVEHAGPRLTTGDAAPLLRGARLGLTGFCTGGQCFDACKSTKVGRFRAADGDIPAMARSIARVYRERADSFFTAQYQAWLEHVARTPIEHFRYECRWPIEQSGCAWQAPKEQLYDTQLLERFAAANFGRFTALTMALPFDMRRARDYEPEMVRRLVPELAEVPRNPGDAELVGSVRAALWRARNASERVRQIRLRAARARRVALIAFDDARSPG